jgi:serine/threonine protein phosphatase PrpC
MGTRDAPPQSPDNAVQVDIAGLTDVGRVRDHNEDSYLIAGLGERAVNRSEEGYQGSLPPAGLLFAVADGMGGAASGEVASRLAVETLLDQLRDGYPPDADKELLERGLEGSLDTANEKIFGVASQDAKHRGMGTTMTAVLACGSRLCFSQIGDSRAYLLRKNELVQLTKDQSLINQLIEDGTLTVEEAEKIGGRNIILQALGVEDAIQADTRHMQLLDEDVIMACSDGLSGMITDEDMQAILVTTPDPAEACRILVDRANENGGRDNVTVIVARFSGGKLRPPAEVSGDVVIERSPSEVTKKPPRTKLFALLGAVLAAVILVLILSTGGKNPLVVMFDVDMVAGSLTPRDADGSLDETRARKFTLGADEKRLQFEDLELGAWELRASRKGYKETTRKITVTTGGTSTEVSLRANSREIKITTNVAGAEVILQAADGETTARTYDGNKPVVFFRDPGEYELIIRHRGYEDLRENVKVGDEDCEITRALKEKLGVLTLAGAAPGSRLWVYDEADSDKEVRGDVDLGESASLNLREGIYRLEIKAPRHRDWDDAHVEISADPPRRIEVDQDLLKGILVIVIGPKARAQHKSFEVRRVATGEIVKPAKITRGEFRYLFEEGEYVVVIGAEKHPVQLTAGEESRVELP